MNPTSKREIVRGKILYYLKLIYPHSATLPLLQGELDLFGYSVSLDDLEFEIAFLEEKLLLSRESIYVPFSGRHVPVVRITMRGADCLCGIGPKHDGICVARQWPEPREKQSSEDKA